MKNVDRDSMARRRSSKASLPGFPNMSNGISRSRSTRARFWPILRVARVRLTLCSAHRNVPCWPAGQICPPRSQTSSQWTRLAPRPSISHSPILLMSALPLRTPIREGNNMNLINLLLLTGKITIRLERGLKELEKARKARKPADSAIASPASGAVHQLKITIKHISPPIWRRILVPDCSLDDLHDVIQLAMGWENRHLFSFTIGGKRYSEPDRAGEMGMADVSRAQLSRLITPAKTRFRYTYDFGDNWEHEILVEKVVPRVEGSPYPITLEGKRACPPEDVGGPWGYQEYIEAIRDPNHERHKDLLEWGGEFDPEAFAL